MTDPSRAPVPDFADMAPALVRGPAEATTPPAFDALVARASRRRRRRTVGGATASAVGLAAVAVLAVGLPPTAPDRPLPGPALSPTATASPSPLPTAVVPWQRSPSEVIARGRVLSAAISPHLDVLTTWRWCERDRQAQTNRCGSTWRLRTHDGHEVSGPVSRDEFAAMPYLGAFLIEHLGSSRVLRVDDAGQQRPLPVAEDTLVYDRRLVAAPVSGSLVDEAGGHHTLPPGWGSLVAGSGSGVLWRTGTDAQGRPAVLWTAEADGGDWSSRPLGDQREPTSVPGYLAVDGTHAAALSTYDGATVAPVGHLAVTTDNGATWSDVGKDELPFTHVDSVAAGDGRLWVVSAPTDRSERARLYRSDTSWTRFSEVALPDGEPSAVTSGGRGVVVQLLEADATRLATLGATGAAEVLEP